MVCSQDKYSHKPADKHPKGWGHANYITTSNVKWHPNRPKARTTQILFPGTLITAAKIPKAKPCLLTGW